MVSFAEIYDRYSQDVFRFALYLSGDRALAEDIVSETFVRAWTAPGELRAATVKSYLLAIARNLYRTEREKQSRHSGLAASIADRAPDPEMAASDRERLSVVLDGVARLPEVDRCALLLRVLEDIPYEEIAATLGLSLAAAKVKVHRARLKLAEFAPQEEKSR